MANTKIPSELVAINAISGTLIADNAITSVHIAENNITATQIAINAVTALQMADGTITSAKIADGTIVTADIADGQITTGKLADSSVTQAKIGSGAVVAGSIASGTITSTQMAGNSVSTANVQDNAINLDKMAGITRGSIIYGNAAGNPAYLAAGTNGHVLTSDGTDISWTADTDLFLASSGGTVSGTLTVDAGSSGMIDFGNVTTAYGRLYADNSGTFIGSKSNHPLILRTNHTTALTLDTSQNATFAGTISSGAITSSGTSTFADVTIGGTGDSQSLIQMLANSTNGANTIHFGDAASGTASYTGYINYAHNTNQMQFATNGGSVRFVLDSRGNAGIGTTPSTGWVNSTDFAALQIGSGLALWGRGSGDHERIGLTANIYHDGSAYKHIHTGRVTSYEQNDGKHIFKYHASQSAGTSVTPNTAMTIDTQGNVGIGTAAPRYLLETRADIDSFVMKVENDGNSPGTSGASYADASDGLWVDTRWNTATNTPFKVTSNSGTTPMMIIKGDGKVGIGTNAPYFPLHVQGPTGFNGEAKNNILAFDTASATTGTGGGIGFGGYTNGTGGDLYHFGNIQGIKENSTAGNKAAAMIFSTRTDSATPVEQMRISSTGNVGIGATSVDELLHLQKSSGTTMVKTEVAANSTVGFEIQKTGPTTSNWRIVDGQTVNGSLEIYDVTDSRQVMVFDGEGDIGMGVTPATHAKLTLGGTRTSYSSVLAFDNNTTGGATFFMLASDNTWSAGGNKFLMGHGSPSSASVDVAIDADGKVGIGATSPGTNLHIGAGTAGENLGVKLNRGATTNFFVACDNTKQAYIGVDNTNSYIKLGSLSNHDVAISQNNAHAIYIDTNKKSKFYGNVELADGKPIFSETDNGTHQYSHLCTGSFYQGSNQGVAINTNIPSYNVSGNNMFMFTIKGYVYDNTGGGIIDCCIGTYSGEGAFHNNSYTAQNIPKQWQGKIRLAYNSSNKVVVLLGDTDTTTNYEIAVDCAVQGFNGVDPAYFTGWTMSHFTSTSAYSGITTVKPKETQLIGFEAYSTGFTKTSGWSQISANMSTESFDFGGYYNTSNGRFTPLVAGLYQFNVGGYSSYADSTGSARYAFAISKNGSLNRIAGGNFCAGDSPLVSITKNVYLNGTSDYVELRMYSAIGGSGITVGHSSHPMWWEGYLISPSRGDETWTI